MITDADLREIYANAPVVKDTFEVISVSAPWFTRTYYLQNTFTDGVDITLEDDVTVVTAEYAPMTIGLASSNADMSYTREFTIQQVNDVIAAEIAGRDPTLRQKVRVESRGYLMYRDGTISLLKTPVVGTEVTKTSRDSIGTTISTATKPVNNTSTGEVATVTRVPMLKGFL